MKRIIYLSILLTLFSNCSGSSKISMSKNKVKVKPEISIKILNKNGIVAYNPNYKKNYPIILPYFLYNENNVFNDIRGDFINVKNNQIANLNLMVGYWKNYGYYKNTFIVLAAMSENSKGSLNEIPISVKSSKFGVFLKGKPKNNPFSKIQQRILFTKEIEINNDFEIIDKIYDDVITVTIGDQNYKFLNPELELK